MSDVCEKCAVRQMADGLRELIEHHLEIALGDGAVRESLLAEINALYTLGMVIGSEERATYEQVVATTTSQAVQ